jgi:DNA-directed RNA polymerase specialized sigma24 family protein
MSAGPLPSKQELRDAYARALLYALKQTRSRPRSEELVQAAMVAAVDGPTAWDPSRHPPFASHVCNLIYSRMGNESQSYETEHYAGSVTPEVENTAPDVRDPEAVLLDRGDESLAAKRMAALEAKAEGDALVRILLDGADGEGDEASSARAIAAGHSARDIEFARRRLARLVAAVVRELPDPVEDA